MELKKAFPEQREFYFLPHYGIEDEVIQTLMDKSYHYYQSDQA
jgi:hypothetical protein